MSSAIVLTLAGPHAEAAIANHAAYCAARGYRHVVVDVSRHPDDMHFRCNHKFQAALHWLGACAEDGLLAVLTDQAVVLAHADLAALMQGRDALAGQDFDGRAMGAATVWRRSARGREWLAQCVRGSAIGSHLANRGGEAGLLAPLAPLHWNEAVAGLHFAIPALHFVDSVWMRVPTFAAIVGPLREAQGGQGQPLALRDAIAGATCGASMQPADWAPLWTCARYAVPDEPLTVFNPGRPVALVMLYTPHIAAFGRIAETRLREYCEAAGYTAYVYRDLPEGMAPGASGNWAKPWVLRTHLADHHWVFWMDADILIQSFAARLEPLLPGRDALPTWDIGGWRMNSGLFGLRHSPAARELLDRMVERTTQVGHKAGVYHSGGDQPLWIHAFEETGWLQDAQLVDVLALNTPWYFQQPDSFMVHYFSIWTELRAVLMDAAYRRTGRPQRFESDSRCPTS